MPVQAEGRSKFRYLWQAEKINQRLFKKCFVPFDQPIIYETKNENLKDLYLVLL